MAERHTLVKEIFAAACLEPAGERRGYVARACADDADLLREIESLLAFYDDRPVGNDDAPRLRARARSQPARPRLRRGRVLAGRYRIERLLGQGGMGEVYAVFDATLRETVALKILPGASTEERRRLLEEVRLARQVTHPGVCRVYDFGEDAGTPFFTMQLIEGETLATRLERTGAMSSEDVAAIARRLASALAAAHEAGVLHRDLKPSNILVAKHGALYVTDFGIATRRTRVNGDRDADHRRFGTPAYMAPEECEPAGVATQRTDLYALGLVLYELVTGTVPFDAPDLETVLEMQRATLPEPPSRRAPEVDRGLEALILQLLAKDPAHRPESAAAVLAALAHTATDSFDGETGPQTERRPIVTLCATLAMLPDLRSSRLWPALVRTFQARCAAIGHLHGGRVAQHLENGLLVQFGLPQAGEQDAERAVETALAILAEQRERPLLATDAGCVEAAIVVDVLPATVTGGVAIATGGRNEALCRIAASVDRGQAIVTSELLPLLRGSFASTTLSGTHRDALFRVDRRRQRLGLQSAGRLAPFVGRGLELARLELWWRDAVAGRGQVVLLSGEAGLGKSRLAHELWRRVRSQGIAFEARCSSLYSHVPLLPFMRMVAQVAGLEPGEHGAAAIEKVRRALAPLGPRVSDLLPIFQAWMFPSLAASAPLPPSTELDRRAAIGAIEESVLALAGVAPLLLLIEDLQWSDPSTRDAVDRLVALTRTQRILLVLTFRNEHTAPWRGTGINHLALQPLTPEQAHAMLAILEMDEAVVAALIDRADGNPFFVEELAAHTGDLGFVPAPVSADLEEGANEPSRAAISTEVPVSLRGLLAARLDRLGSAKALAQAASVCGRIMSYRLLAALAGEGPERLRLEANLARLLDAEILVQHGPLPRAMFTFRHILLRDSAYASLPARERRRLHAAVAHALPDVDPGISTRSPEVIALHWSAAGRNDLAFDHWRRAGMRALERSAYDEADHDFEQALAALASATLPRERRQRRIEIHLARTSIAMATHGPGSSAAARRVRRAERLLQGPVAVDLVARTLFLSARINVVRGQLPAALRKLERLQHLEPALDPYLHSAILAQAGSVLGCLGRFDAAEQRIEAALAEYSRAQERPTGSLTSDPLVQMLFARGVFEWARGRPSEARATHDRAVDHADRLGHPFSRALIRLYRATLALLDGDMSLFVEALAEGRRLAREIDAEWLLDLAELYAPHADSDLDAAERIRRIRAALDRTPGTRMMRSLAIAELAELLHQTGDGRAALEAMDEAVTETRRRMDGFLAPEILRRRGVLLGHLGFRREARATLRRAMKTAHEAGAFGLELRAAASLERLLTEHGDERAGRGVLDLVLARVPAGVEARSLVAPRALRPDGA